MTDETVRFLGFSKSSWRSGIILPRSGFILLPVIIERCYDFIKRGFEGGLGIPKNVASRKHKRRA